MKNPLAHLKKKGSSETKDKLSSLERLIGYRFKDRELLKRAITHPSATPENETPYFERMEFLGDSIVGMVVSEELYFLFPQYQEGELSKLKAQLVSRRFLALRANSLGLQNYVIVHEDNLKNNDKSSSTILSNAMESLVCAIYLDSDLETTRNFIKKKLLKDYKIHIREDDLVNYKSILQEYAQSKYQNVPDYVLIDEKGPEHEKIFSVKVKVNGRILGSGVGSTKKQAQQNAAKQACEKLNL